MSRVSSPRSTGLSATKISLLSIFINIKIFNIITKRVNATVKMKMASQSASGLVPKPNDRLFFLKFNRAKNVRKIFIS